MSDDALFGDEELAAAPKRPAGEPQVVLRADGSPYRARKVPEAIAVHLCGFGPGVLVVRCHDLDVADVIVALATTTDEEIKRRVVDTVDLPGVPVWVRYVPDLDEHGKLTSNPGSYERELRGTAGATPAVLYAREVRS